MPWWPGGARRGCRALPGAPRPSPASSFPGRCRGGRNRHSRTRRRVAPSRSTTSRSVPANSSPGFFGSSRTTFTGPLGLMPETTVVMVASAMTIRSLLFAALFFAPVSLEAHVGDHPSVHDTVANIIERMRGTLDPDDLRKLNSEKVEQFLTPEERHQVYKTLRLKVIAHLGGDVESVANGGPRPGWRRRRPHPRCSACCHG